MRVALVQHDIAFEQPEKTRARLDELLDGLAGVDLVVLAEMHATGFTMNPERFAEDETGPTFGWLRATAERTGATVAASLPWRHPDGTFTNRMLLVAPDGATTAYDKLHPFGYGKESEHYRAGEALASTTVAGVRVTPFVCYDLRFANAFWQTGPDTDVFVVVANWPAARREHWKALLRARAIENQCFVVAVNRVGRDPGLDYAGDSTVIDPLGEVVADLGEHEQVRFVDLDISAVQQTRDQFPFLADRRRDLG